MNDELLFDSQKRRPVAQFTSNEHTNLILSGNLIPKDESQLGKLKIQRKRDIILHRISVIMGLSVLTFIMITSTIFNIEWFLIAEDISGNKYWINFLFFKKSCNRNPLNHPTNSESLGSCLTQSTDFSVFLPTFYLEGCKYGESTLNDQPGLCNEIGKKYRSGILLAIFTGLGLIAHGIHIFQLIYFSNRENLYEIKNIHSLKLAFCMIIFYLGSFSCSLFAFNLSVTTGSSFFCYTAALGLDILLVGLFAKLKFQAANINSTTKLLDAKEKYNKEINSL